jgi:multidrug resistance efflux pump
VSCKKGMTMPHLQTKHRWLIAIVVLLVLYLIFYVTADRITPNTDDAYVEAHVVQVAPRVSGRVTRVAVQNNQWVKKGQLLFSLNAQKYQHAYSRAKALLDESYGETNSMQAVLESAQDAVKKSEENLAYVTKQYKAMSALAHEGAIARLKFQSVSDQYHQKGQALLQARAHVLALEQQLHKVGGQFAQVLEAKAGVDQAQQNLNDTKIYAPFNGRVTFLRVSPGMYANAGTPVIALIDTNQWWVIARIKENNLGRIHKGERVDVSPEAYPGTVLSGVVNSIGWGVNLDETVPAVWMPYIPSTRNWVHLAQRFPVEINIKTNLQHPLRVGGSATVTIYTERAGIMDFLGHLRQRVQAWLQFIY